MADRRTGCAWSVWAVLVWVLWLVSKRFLMGATWSEAVVHAAVMTVGLGVIQWLVDVWLRRRRGRRG
ncbi:hypothetical protein [Arsenicicoccus dermatophilus]|uniref:hypothetical protein n=1 Tax=Arsenicicoccus dermatophilus TaxID=1076331 RepID=UPI001F4D00A4|nr:hypothetical protein [Arsenicicoccus dermatophilus]MCH8613415.1 hypothetical protein [Arsenicicoccus dermatophilus]